MRAIIFILFFGCLFSCKKKDLYPEVRIFGHAGSGIDISTSPYQENTLEALEYSFSFSEVAGAEIDLQWSKDGTPWLYHDDDLSEQTNASGRIIDKTDEELATVRYKGLNQEKLVKLTEVAGLIGSKELILDLKLASSGLTLQEIQNGLSEFVSMTQGVKISVILQNMDNASYFQSLGWDVYINVNSVSDYYSIAQWENSTGCCVSNLKISKDDVNGLHSLAKKVIIFGARAPKRIREALKKGSDLFLADDVKATLIEKIR